MQKSLNDPLRYLKGIGLKRAKALNKLGINTVEDFLYYFPRRYEDRTNFVPISGVQKGKTQTIKAEILTQSERHSFRRRGFSITEVVVTDKTAKIFCVWFNQPYLKAYFKVGQTLILYGKIEEYAGRLQMNSPEFEMIEAGQWDSPLSLNIGRITPIYSLPEGITQRNFRRIIKYVLDTYISCIHDFLSFDIRSRNNLLNLAKGLINIHFPENLDLKHRAYVRLAFDEFFLFQLPLALRKLKRKEKQGIAHQVGGELVDNFIAHLPFELTAGQKKSIEEIKTDMRKPQNMQRLLQGDVGSGKTVVATIASLVSIQGGYQVAFMVPTEILAEQHFEKIKNQISILRLRSGSMVSEIEPSILRLRSGSMVSEIEPSKIKNKEKEIQVRLLTSAANKKEKNQVYKEIASGRADLIIGTHALLEEEVKFKRLGLVVIDEQHKFGVGQRALLPQKGLSPDVLIMTATPIPRTLAITLYADLDISVMRELPPGRLPIKTVHFPEAQKSVAYALAREHLDQDSQVYIVYPVIEESYALDIAGAKKMYAQLKQTEFKKFKLELIHGRLAKKEQGLIMAKFKDKKLDILVSTTVLEVGIDVPNATCMLVEHAERFGLSQLHQLRGRVGRGRKESLCILVSDTATVEASARIKAMIEYQDGFRIAEEDLKIRGPGEFFGSRQHGLTELRIANPLTQLQLLKQAKEEATKLINIDPHLGMRQNLLLKAKLLQKFPEYEKLMLVG